VAIEELSLAPSASTGAPAPAPTLRCPPKANCILLPVWGDIFITQFLEKSLPTLLADGNIPALAKALPTRFVFLTRASDESTFRSHPAFRHLADVCAVEFLPIDDLITRSNHSTTVTLAYARAVRRAGEAMLDTCFFFLVSDYIMADGSLAAVLARMLGGASAVQVGNFQLEEISAEDWLLDRLSGVETSLALTPREIMGYALGCLHPLTAANIVNFPLCHNSDTNRLLWRVDADTLIGRFYLLHMICIRPETTDFVIGSSCDYSFVPEMCPSGNVVTITDSDDYLVVEVQPGNHENHFLRLGSASVDALAKSLSEWTTAGHRANAEQTIVFHAGSLPASLPAARAEMDDFVARVARRLSPKPQPHRDHPYWIGAVAAFDKAVMRRESGLDRSSMHVIVRGVHQLQVRCFGQTPEVARTHPRWQDFNSPLATCSGLPTDSSARWLIGASRSTPLTDWLRRRVPEGISFSIYRMMRNRPMRGAERGSFDIAFVELVDNEIAETEQILQRITPLMRPGGQVIVAAFNGDWFKDPQNFGRFFAGGLGSLVRLGLWPESFHIATSSRLRWWINNTAIEVATKLYKYPTIFLPFHLVLAAALFPLMVVANVISSWLPNRLTRRRIVSSVFVRFILKSNAAAP